MYLNDYDVFVDVVYRYNDLAKKEYWSDHHKGHLNLSRGMAWLAEAEVVTGELADVRRLHIPDHESVSGWHETLLFEAFGTLRRAPLPGDEFTLFQVAAKTQDGEQPGGIEALFQEFRHAEAFRELRENFGDGSYAITAAKRVLALEEDALSLAAWATPPRSAGDREDRWYDIRPMTVGEGGLHLKLPVGTFLREEDAVVFEKAIGGTGGRMLTITETVRTGRHRESR